MLDMFDCVSAIVNDAHTGSSNPSVVQKQSTKEVDGKTSDRPIGKNLYVMKLSGHYRWTSSLHRLIDAFGLNAVLITDSWTI